MMRMGSPWGRNKLLNRDNGVVGDQTGTEQMEQERKVQDEAEELEPVVEEQVVKKAAPKKKAKDA